MFRPDADGNAELRIALDRRTMEELHKQVVASFGFTNHLWFCDTLIDELCANSDADPQWFLQD